MSNKTGSARSAPAKPTRKSTAKTAARKAPTRGFSDEERAAMKERVAEAKAAARRGGRSDEAEGEAAVLAKIAAMEPSDCAMAEQLHALVRAAAPDLVPKLWYGMPAYARGEKVVCFFQDARKFKTRYATLGFSDKAKLDEGAMWPTAFALTAWSDAIATRIVQLVTKATG